jgi:hypothetical protein
MVQINDGQVYLVSDLTFEALNDDDLLWKPYAQLKETFKLFFGCDEFCNIPEVDSGSESEPAPSGSGSEPEPEINYYVTAAVNFNITEVVGPGLPDLGPTGLNGGNSGTHIGMVDGDIFVTIVGTVVIATKLVILIDNIQVACQVVTGSDTYIFPNINLLSSEELRITINIGPC